MGAAIKSSGSASRTLVTMPRVGECGPAEASSSKSLPREDAGGYSTTPSGLCANTWSLFPKRISSSSKGLEERLARLELECISQRDKITKLEAEKVSQKEQFHNMQLHLTSVSKDVPGTVSVLQYNILASYLGSNQKPWFLYGSDVSDDMRARIFEKYNSRDESGNLLFAGWPKFVEGLLTPDEIAAVEESEEWFDWEFRKHRLVDQLYAYDADVFSLVELDQYDWFNGCLGHIWASAFHKRPRTSSLDGCGVFWRRSKFLMETYEAHDFLDDIDTKGREKKDRSCLLVLLRWRSDSSPLVMISTHLARNPEDRAQTAVRVRQVTQMLLWLTEFTNVHHVRDAPVILLGDLNAQHFGEIRGIARTVWQIKGDPVHPFLWHALDVPTGPTSITKARQCRIDVVQYLNSHLEILEILPVPVLPAGEAIPNCLHPSDHFPVYVKFKAKDTYTKHKQCACAWLECVAGKQKVHPLTEEELTIAFEFFDRDRSSQIHRHELEVACIELHTGMCDAIQRAFLDCFPDHEISWHSFVRAYELRLKHDRIRNVGDLESAFRYLAGDSRECELSKLETAFREITPVQFSDDEVSEMFARLGLSSGQDKVDVRRFCEVVCQATFQHRPKVQRSTAQPTRKSSCVARMGTTKDLGVRLENFNVSQTLKSLNGSAMRSPLLGPSARPRSVSEECALEEKL